MTPASGTQPKIRNTTRNGIMARIYSPDVWSGKAAYRAPEAVGESRPGIRRYLFLYAWAELHKKHGPRAMPRRVRRAICRDIMRREYRALRNPEVHDGK